MTYAKPADVAYAEDDLREFEAENFEKLGPGWPELDESERLRARVRALYEQHDVPEFERIVGI